MRNHLFNTPCEECPARLISVFCNIDKQSVELLEAGRNTEFYKAGTTIFQKGLILQGYILSRKERLKYLKMQVRKENRL